MINSDDPQHKNEPGSNSVVTTSVYSVESPKKIYGHLSHRQIVMSLLSVAIVLAIGLFAWFYYDLFHTSHTQLLKTGEISTPAGGTIKFAKPANFKSPEGDITAQPLQTFQLRQKINSKTITSSYLIVSTTPISPDILSNLNNLDTYLTESPNSTAYKTASAPITSFAQTMLSLYSKSVLSNAAPLRTSNIRSNAWQFDLSATDGKTGAPDLHGKAIYAWTKKATYSYVLAVATDQWQASLPTWQAMIDSISLE